MENPPVIAETFTAGIVQRWITAIDTAYEARKGWDDTVWLCREFYRGAIDFMWSEQFQNKYFGGKLTPRFKVNLNKMFDMVALYAPSLVWDQVTRVAKSKPPFEYGPEVFGNPEDPIVQALFNERMHRQQGRQIADHYQAAAFNAWLNHTPREMPDGGMVRHSERAAVDALISGRGVQLPETYKVHGSNKKSTGCFWTCSEDILWDPDCTNEGNAQFLIIRCVEPQWKVERDRGYAEGAFDKAMGIETLSSRVNRYASHINRAQNKREGKAYRNLVYYKIYSRMGIGGRLRDCKQPYAGVRGYLDKLVGDYAYLEIADGINHPLNCNPARLREASDDEVERMFHWPVPWWIDGRWPVAMLDFYHRDDMPYPIPPMAAALGPLIYMNIAMANLANRVWSSSRDFIGIMESAWDTVAKYFKGGDDLALIKIPQIHQDMEQIVKFFKQPPVSADQYQMLDRMSQEFVLASGLNPIMYAENAGGTQSRSARDADSKERMAGIRPMHMAKKVDEHQANCAEMEKQLAYWKLDGRDVDGVVPGFIWDKFIVQEEEPERIIRNLRMTVDAQSGRRPNKSRDAENLKTLLPAVLPELSKHADMTGDTGPLNWVLDQWGQSIEQDMSGTQMGPRVPQPPPPEVAQQQQQIADAEMAQVQAKTEADIIKAKAAIAKANADGQNAAVEAQIKRDELAQRAMESRITAEGKLNDLMIARDKSRLDIASKAELDSLKIASAESLAVTKIATAEEMARIAAQAAHDKATAAKAAAKAKPRAKAKASA